MFFQNQLQLFTKTNMMTFCVQLRDSGLQLYRVSTNTDRGACDASDC